MLTFLIAPSRPCIVVTPSALRPATVTPVTVRGREGGFSSTGSPSAPFPVCRPSDAAPAHPYGRAAAPAIPTAPTAAGAASTMTRRFVRHAAVNAVPFCGDAAQAMPVALQHQPGRRPFSSRPLAWASAPAATCPTARSVFSERSNHRNSVAPDGPVQINFAERRSEMAMRSCPVEDHVIDLKSILRAHLEEALEDGEVSPGERRVYELLTNAHSNISSFSRRRRFAQHLERTGEVTRYMESLAEDAGLGIIDLAAERAALRPKVVPFPTRNGGPGAS